MAASGFNARDALRGQSMLRAADAMLRVLGGTEVTLRLPGQPVGEATAVELGLVQPLVEDVPLTPVVVLPIQTGPRRGQRRYDLLCSASAIGRLVEGRSFNSVEALFNALLGIVYAGKLLHVESLSAEEFGGVPSVYRVTANE